MSRPMSGRAINTAEIGAAIFDGVIAHYAAASAVVPLPDRRYIAPGDAAAVAWDCEQFTVSIIGVGLGLAPDVASGSAKPGTHASVTGMRHAVFSACLVRCTPTIDRDGPPEISALHPAGVAYLRDVGLISQALVEIGSRLHQIDRSAIITAGNAQPIGPGGGFVGLEGQLTISTVNLS